MKKKLSVKNTVFITEMKLSFLASCQNLNFLWTVKDASESAENTNFELSEKRLISSCIIDMTFYLWMETFHPASILYLYIFLQIYSL